MQDFRKLPERLLRLMKLKGIRAVELARRMKQNPSTICRYLKGERIPSLPTIERIEIILGGKIL